MSKSNNLASILGDGTRVFVDSDHIPSNIVYGSGGLEAGTVAFFGQTAAPTGWTKDTSIDNTALRVVSGTVGSGGNDGFTTTFGTGKSTAGHTLTTAQMPSHSHLYYFRNGSGSTPGPGFGYQNLNNSRSTSNEGGGQAHSHNLANFDLKYVDVIKATKG